MGFWVFTRTSLTLFINDAPLSYLYGFLFIFNARMTFSGVLFILFIFIFPYLKLNLKSELKIILLGIYLVLPFFVHSMYYYQSLSLLIIIFAAILLNFIFNQFFEIINEYRMKEKKFHKIKFKLISNYRFNRGNNIKQKWAKIFLMALLIFSSFTTLGIQFYRSISDGHPVNTDIIEMANYLNSRDESEIRIFSSGTLLSYQISSYSEKTKSLPCYTETFISYFPEVRDNITTSIKNISFTINGMIDLARNGRYSTNIRSILNVINRDILAENVTMEENITVIKSTMDFLVEFDFDFLLRDSQVNWTLFDLFVTYEIITFETKINDLLLYKLNYPNIQLFLSTY